jgi:hypothetical protein
MYPVGNKVAFVIGWWQIGHSPYREGSTGRPRGCGNNICGGGIAGPVGAEDSARAGDEGEYHHSRNLTKKMDNGRRTLSDSNRR